jgi:polysaccharide export outer membrane protein
MGHLAAKFISFWSGSKNYWLLLNAVWITLVSAIPSLALPLSPGDRLNIFIREGEGFSGIYEVNLDGKIDVPYLSPLAVVGLEPFQVEQTLTQALVQAGMFQPNFIQVSVKVLEWASVEVTVAGATFEPGRVSLNKHSSDANSAEKPVQISGDYPPERYLTSAIRAAGGVLPSADLKTVRLIRGDRESTIDLSGVFTGSPVNDIPLIAGDRIIVPKAERNNNNLVRPSQITPPGVRVFLSNLTIPAPSNSASAIGQDSTSFPYGSRFSQAVISANCAGGTQATNAKRRAVLVHTDRFTGQTKYVDRPIEDLLRKSTDDTVNPFLMPNDGVACYDSKVTNLRDVARTLGEVFSPFSFLFKLIFR